MRQILFSLSLICGMALTLPPAMAQQTQGSEKKAPEKKASEKKGSEKKKSEKKPKAKKSSANKAGAAAKPVDEDDIKPDVTGSTSTDFKCELGNQVTIYENNADDKYIAVRWKDQLYRMTRVDTTTGANRFENKKYGLVWIGIPAKSILLNAKKGQQLANECKNVAQMMQPAAPAEGTAMPPATPTPQNVPADVTPPANAPAETPPAVAPVTQSVEQPAGQAPQVPQAPQEASQEPPSPAQVSAP